MDGYIGHDTGFADGRPHERANPTNVLKRPDVKRAWDMASLIDTLDVREALAVAIILKSPDAPDPLRDPGRLGDFADWLYRFASIIAEQRNAQRARQDMDRRTGSE